MNTCSAPMHGTDMANRLHGCICPEALAARRAWRPAKVRSVRGPGRPERLISEQNSADIRRLTRMGESAAAIAIRLGISERTVVRHRSRARQEAV